MHTTNSGNVNELNSSLCKTCEHRFRRVFTAFDRDDVVDGTDGVTVELDSHTFIVNVCIASNIELDVDITVECNKYTPMESKDTYIENSILKHKHR